MRRENYPWRRSAGRLLLDAVPPGMQYRFPYRSLAVSEGRNGHAKVRSTTVAPTWPPTELTKTTTMQFSSIGEAMAWCEGVYDEALGNA